MERGKQKQLMDLSQKVNIEANLTRKKQGRTHCNSTHPYQTLTSNPSSLERYSAQANQPLMLAPSST